MDTIAHCSLLYCMNILVCSVCSASQFSDHSVGTAVPDSICTDRSVVVLSDDSDHSMLTAEAMTHMVAHVLGVRHEDTAGELGVLNELSI